MQLQRGKERGHKKIKLKTLNPNFARVPYTVEMINSICTAFMSDRCPDAFLPP